MQQVNMKDVPALQNIFQGSRASDADVESINSSIPSFIGGNVPPMGKGLYWDARHPKQGGTQRVHTSERSPGQDWYRLVDSIYEAEMAMSEGEYPIVVGNLEDIDPESIDPAVLRQLQEDQYAAPNGVPMFIGVNDKTSRVRSNPMWRP